jgi:hypothetical protein
MSMALLAVSACSGGAHHAGAQNAVAKDADQSISHPTTPKACNVFTRAAVGSALHAQVSVPDKIGPSWSCSYTTTEQPMVSVTGALQEGPPTALSRVLRDQVRQGGATVPSVGDEAVWTRQGDLIVRSGRWLTTVSAKQGLNGPDRAAAAAVARESIPLLPR